MPLPTGKSLTDITFGNGPPKFFSGGGGTGSATSKTGGVSGPPGRFVNSKGTGIKNAHGFSGTVTKDEKPVGMTKDTLLKVLEAFEIFLESGAKEGPMGPYTFLAGGGAFRVLNGISIATNDIDIWSISESDSQKVNDAGKEFSQSPAGKSYNLNFDFFNGALSSGMVYYDGSKLFEAYAQDPSIVPMWQSPKKRLTLYALPIEWQIQTKLMRMSNWYKSGLMHDEKYLNDMQHVLSLMWKISDKGKDKLNILGVAGWLSEYQISGNKFSYAGGLLEAVNSRFVEYVENGGKGRENEGMGVL